MKYCSHCGAQLSDDAKFCTACGQPVEPTYTSAGNTNGDARPFSTGVTSESDQAGLETAAEVFMVISLVVSAFTIIALAWNIPMTVHVFRCVKRNLHIGVGFKVCALLFCSLVGGILLLCRNEYGMKTY